MCKCVCACVCVCACMCVCECLRVCECVVCVCVCVCVWCVCASHLRVLSGFLCLEEMSSWTPPFCCLAHEADSFFLPTSSSSWLTWCRTHRGQRSCISRGHNRVSEPTLLLHCNQS